MTTEPLKYKEYNPRRGPSWNGFLKFLRLDANEQGDSEDEKEENEKEVSVASQVSTATAAASALEETDDGRVEKQKKKIINTPSIKSSSSVSSGMGSETGSTGSDKSTKRCTFVEEVKVVPIPRRDEYSDRMKDRLWTSTAEITMNAQRNTIEYQSEGWDWRTALEDENMYTCSVTGELIHPVHCE